MSWPGPESPRWPAAARLRAAAARELRRPPWSARRGSQRLVEGAGPDRDERQQLTGLVAQGCLGGARGSSSCLSVAGSPEATCRSIASKVPSPRRIGSPSVSLARPSSASRVPPASFSPSPASASCSRSVRRTGLSIRRQRRELGRRIGVVLRQQRLSGRGEPGGLGCARLLRPMVPANLGGGGGHDQHRPRPGRWHRSDATGPRTDRGAVPRRPRG